jgi:CDP-diacylglycerol--glycerol-3-phosphate 3-phosphatidyltransferase
MFTLANKLTFLRLFLIIPFMTFMLLDSMVAKWVAFIIFVTASLLDYFDGVCARKRNEMTKLGALLDPIADKLLVVTGFVFLLIFGEFSTDLSAVLALLMILRDVLIAGVREYLAHFKQELPVSFLAKGKTAFQLAAISFLLLPIEHKDPVPDVLMILAAISSFGSAYFYLKEVFSNLTKLDEKN